jgi:hypothetical protein
MPRRALSGITERIVEVGLPREWLPFQQGRPQRLVNPLWDSHGCSRRFEPSGLLATSLDVGPEDR